MAEYETTDPIERAYYAWAAGSPWYASDDYYETFEEGWRGGAASAPTELRSEVTRLRDIIDSLNREVADLRATEHGVAVLVNALCFYAEEDNYTNDGIIDGDRASVPVLEDDGDCARAALARYAVDDEGRIE